MLKRSSGTVVGLECSSSVAAALYPEFDELVDAGGDTDSGRARFKDHPVEGGDVEFCAFGGVGERSG